MNEKKIALVAGGSSGVGLSIVKALIQQDYFTVFIGSNEKKGRELEAEFNRTSVKTRFVCLDLSKLRDVYQLTVDFIQKHERLDLLVNTAGVVLPKRKITDEGFEKTFAVGYLSPFILSVQLSQLLKKTEGARIVNVAGQAKMVLNTKLDFENLNFHTSYNGFKTSIATVHAKTVLTKILAGKFAKQGIDVNSFYPGIVRSALTRNLPVIMRAAAKLFLPFMSKDSQNGIYVSCSQKIRGVSGKLFVNKKPVSLLFDNQYQEKLWDKTTTMLKRLNLELYENS